MPRIIIVDRTLQEDTWETLPRDAALPDSGNVIAPLETWRHVRESARARSGAVGVWLAPDDDPAGIAPDVERLPVIAVQFPQFADGRGYSTARLLRARHGFRGQLRAFGEVLRDQLFYLERVGFNAFALKEGRNVADALAAFADFSEAYQASALAPEPPYRRRTTAAGA
ncbi:MAG: DUF934 domain-containing protein [Burkholderiales bacterium]|nr:DUF934 domain-containing protein [Burkholderiales bacterium]